MRSLVHYLRRNFWHPRNFRILTSRNKLQELRLIFNLIYEELEDHSILADECVHS